MPPMGAQRKKQQSKHKKRGKGTQGAAGAGHGRQRPPLSRVKAR